MINKLKVFFSILLASCSLLAVPVSAVAPNSNPIGDVCDTNLQTLNSPICQKFRAGDKSNPISGTNGIIAKATNIIAIVAALGAVINIVIGAFEFVTAGGTGFKSATANPAPTKAAKARSRVTSGAIGLAIVALAWLLVRFVEDRVIR